MTQHSLILRLFPLLLSAGLAGCGSGDPYSTVSASGMIRYADGSLIPAARISLVFVPQVPAIDAKTHPRHATAEVNVEDGTFSNLSTFQFGDGVIPGSQKVLVRAFDEQDGPSPAVPDKYGMAETTPLEVQIERRTSALVLEIDRR